MDAFINQQVCALLTELGGRRLRKRQIVFYGNLYCVVKFLCDKNVFITKQ